MHAAAHARAHPDQLLYLMADSGESLTYAQYEAAVNRLAHLYRDQGLVKGDHLAVLMENNLRFLEAVGAAERTGLYFTCVNSHLTADEAAYIVNDSRARIVVTSWAMREVAAGLPGQCAGVERWLMADVPPGGAIPDGFESYEAAVAGFPIDPITDEQLGASMAYTSGTTGRPKGILRPLPDADPAEAPPIVVLAQKLFGFREGLTYLSPAPLYHAAPLASVGLVPRLGGSAVIMERFDAQRYLELIAEHRITHSQVVPTMFTRLLKLPEHIRSGADISSLEWIVHAAAPCPIQTKRDMIEWFGPIILEYYGASENNGFTWCDTEEWLAHPGTVGRPVVGELTIRDENDAECPVGQAGTIWFSGASGYEYFNAPEKTAESRDPSGSRTTVGDVGHVDADGYLYLTDRKNFMIISGGVNIYPQETENLLITHPKVMDAAVIGVPNEDLGEEVKAVVQLVDGIGPDDDVADELMTFCVENLAKFKCPRSIDFVDELPRLPTGKLYKRLLRDRYWGNEASTIV